MIIPIRTEMVSRRRPLANYAIVGLNVLVYVVINVLAGGRLNAVRDNYLLLQGDWPSIYQFFTYQFLHADIWHLGGNMLFLWVFGNSVNAKMGDVVYALFYLAGGVFAGVAFMLASSDRLLGASGAIAAVTTAYLVLFPRSRVTVLFVFIFITFFEVPAMVLIGAKIIVWDTIIAPAFGSGGNVAFSAHLGGYLFGLVVATVMLLIHAIPRDHFDMLSLLDRWNRRRAFRSALSSPDARLRAEYGTVARPLPRTPEEQKAEDARFDQIANLRARIAESIERGDLSSATTLYEELTTIDPNVCLPENQQLAVAREFYATKRSPQAAGAFERYLSCYRHAFETAEIGLLLGIIYARDLKQYESAEKHLVKCRDKLKDTSRRQQCAEWLALARRSLGRPAVDA